MDFLYESLPALLTTAATVTPMVQEYVHHNANIEKAIEALKQAQEHHMQEVNLAREQHLRELKAARNMHFDGRSMSQSLHEEQLNIAYKLHGKEKDLALQLHVENLGQQLLHHTQEVKIAFESARRENLRDVWIQKTRKADTILITATLMFASFIALIVEGMPPAESRASLVQLYSALVGLALFLLIVCMMTTMRYQVRMADYNLYNKHEVYRCGKTHDSYESFYDCHCATLSWWANKCFLWGAVSLIAAAACTMYNRFTLLFNNQPAAIIYASMTAATLLTMLLFTFLFPGRTRMTRQHAVGESETLAYLAKDLQDLHSPFGDDDSFYSKARVLAQKAATKATRTPGTARSHLSTMLHLPQTPPQARRPQPGVNGTSTAKSSSSNGRRLLSSIPKRTAQLFKRSPTGAAASSTTTSSAAASHAGSAATTSPPLSPTHAGSADLEAVPERELPDMAHAPPPEQAEARAEAQPEAQAASRARPAQPPQIHVEAPSPPLPDHTAAGAAAAAEPPSVGFHRGLSYEDALIFIPPSPPRTRRSSLHDNDDDDDTADALADAAAHVPLPRDRFAPIGLECLDFDFEDANDTLRQERKRSSFFRLTASPSKRARSGSNSSATGAKSRRRRRSVRGSHSDDDHLGAPRPSLRGTPPLGKRHSSPESPRREPSSPRPVTGPSDSPVLSYGDGSIMEADV